MKIRTLLKVLILEILFILVILVGFVFLYNTSTQKIRKSNKVTNTQLNNLRGLSLDFSDYHNENLSYDALEQKLDLANEDVKNSIKNDEIALIFDNIYNNSKKRESLYQENIKIIDKVYKNTDDSIKESRNYIKNITSALVDEQLRYNVTALERAVVGGAEKNTYNNLMIQNLTEKLKNNFNERDNLLKFLDVAISNTEKDMESLKGSEFYNNVVKAKNLLEGLETTINTYIENTNQINIYEKNTFKSLNDLNLIIDEYDEKLSDDLFNSVQNKMTILGIILIFMLVITVVFSVILYRNINKNLSLVVDNVNRLKVGNLSNIKRSKGKNEFSQIINILSSYADDLKVSLLEKLEKIANGEKIDGTIVKGKDDEIGPKIETMQNTISNLVKEIDISSNETINGNLKYRILIDNFKGDYKKILNGINKTLDSVVEPFLEISEIMKKVKEGNFDIEVKEYKGDYKMFADSSIFTMNYLNKIITEISNTLYQIAEGDLNVNKLEEYKGSYKKMSSSINKIINNLNLLVGDIKGTSVHVADSAKDVKKGSRNLSNEVSNMASSIQEVSSSIQEMNAQTKSSVENAKKANNLVNITSNNADEGKYLMESMLSSMEEINESSENIRKIIKVIDEIAFQTNILAINASIEAEQAGQYGKGFSVVADEVRSLAAKCAKAAKNTTQMIEESVKKVSNGIKISNETSKALINIDKNSTLSRRIVEDITRASEENAIAFEQMNLAVIQISSIIQTTSAISTDSAILSDKLSKQSEKLRGLVKQFDLKDEDNIEELEIENKEINFDVDDVEKSYSFNKYSLVD